MKKSIFIALTMVLCYGTARAQSTSSSVQMNEISAKNYKTFKVSDKVTLFAVTFKNQYKSRSCRASFYPQQHG